MFWRQHSLRSLTPLVYTMAASVGVLSFSPIDLRRIGISPSDPSAFATNHQLTQDLGSLSRRHDISMTRCEASRHSSIDKDYEMMVIPERGFSYGHAIFGVLLGDKMIEKYDIYKRPADLSNADDVIVAHAKFGDKVNGHAGVVHGGILSLVFDDFLGFGFEALGVKKAVTANLNIDFRAPVYSGTEVLLKAQLENREGRKLYWRAQITSMDGEKLYAECTSLYIIPRSEVQ